MEKKSKIIAFRSNDTLRTELGSALGGNAMQLAFEAIRERGIPRSIPQIDARNHPDTIIAHEYHKMVGINLALDLLERLTYPLDTHPEDEKEQEEAFAHTLPPYLREMPKFPYPPKK